MSLPDRQFIQQLIALPCMIQRERAGQALFISDYPLRLTAREAQAAEARLRLAGYDTIRQGSLALIDWQQAAYLAWFEGAALPLETRLPGVGSLLLRHPVPLAGQDAALLSQALRLYLLGETRRLHRLLEQGLAQALREGRPPPYHALALFTQQGGTA